VRHTVERSKTTAALPSGPALGRGELRLAGRAVLVLCLLAVPVAAVAAAMQGRDGALGAVAGLGLVAVLFGASGAAQGLAARRGQSAVLAVAAIGLGVRLALYLVVLQLLAQVAALHRPSLAIATALGFVVTLFYEMRLISRTPELFWVELGDSDRRAAHPRAAR
jgi:hypothetical protein